MFSGGIDSCGVLHSLVTDPDYHDRELIVQHIILQNRENRAQAEMNSVNEIISYYQQHHPERPFTYTESIFNTTGFAPLQASRFPFDMDVCAFMAGNIAVARGIKNQSTFHGRPRRAYPSLRRIHFLSSL